jgi:hypothetical protein
MREREEGRRKREWTRIRIRRRRSEGEGGGRARTWTRQEGEGTEEREEGKVRVRDTTTTKFRITTTPNYLPMESTTHTPKKYFSFNTMYSFYPHPTNINSVFDRILGGNCQVFRGVGSKWYHWLRIITRLSGYGVIRYRKFDLDFV